MDFIVRYRTAAGEEKYEEMATLDRAAGLVERLRNDAGVNDARIYKHVPIEFKTYYKVAVSGEDVSSSSQAASPAPGSGSSSASGDTPAPAAPSSGDTSPSGSSGATATPPSASASGDSSAPSSAPSGSTPLSPPAAKASGDAGDGEGRRTLFTRS